MLLQTNSYIVPREKRNAHERLVRRFRQIMATLGCDDYQVYEQQGPNWDANSATGRFVQLIRFRDRHHHQQVQAAERTSPEAQQLIHEFCELLELPQQQAQGLFSLSHYSALHLDGEGETRALPQPATRKRPATARPAPAPAPATEPADDFVVDDAAPEDLGVNLDVDEAVDGPLDEQEVAPASRPADDRA